jgi:uncharacterized protein (TIGR04540 family)
VSDIIKNPKNVKELGREIRKVCDGYWGRELSEEDAKEMVAYWVKHENRKLFKAEELNPTIRIVIGLKREELILKWIEGFNEI